MRIYLEAPVDLMEGDEIEVDLNTQKIYWRGVDITKCISEVTLSRLLREADSKKPTEREYEMEY